MIPKDTLENRFEKLHMPVTESGCWIWLGAEGNQYGHGTIKIGGRKGKNENAHRFSWRLNVGEIPDGKYVLHKCDVPLCVNPRHLYLGTHQDNMRDMYVQGRHTHGSRHYHSKITEKEASDIKRSDLPTKTLGRIYGLSRQSVADIRYGRTWKHVA